MATKTKGPQFVRYFGPVLDALRALGGSGSPNEVADKIAESLKVSQREQEELTASGQERFLNRVQWARFYLSKDGYISSSERGVWALTDKGRSKVLTQEEALETSNGHRADCRNNDSELPAARYSGDGTPTCAASLARCGRRCGARLRACRRSRSNRFGRPRSGWTQNFSRDSDCRAC